ncbi:MAG: tail fiber protein [Erythrobacter sp.]|nr:tail fiber protein [Erythrobacter sp.]
MRHNASGVRAIPRNSSGEYSLPAGTLVNTGDTLLVSQHNPPMQDLEQAISSSLDRDGKGGMRADLPMGGNKITNVAPGTDPTDVATVSQIASSTGVPIGAVIDYWGATPPEGYLFAAGQEISRSTYADLFAVIGTAAGAGNGSTTFNVPDYRGRVGAGKENMATPATTRLNTLSSSTLGATGGAQTHTLTEAQMPEHDHAVTDPGHTHTESGAESVDAITADGAFSGTVTASKTTGSSTTGITIAEAGSGEAHNNVQPTIICNKIIRVS